jgi:hypothetical protein
MHSKYVSSAGGSGRLPVMEVDETRWREIQALASFQGTSAPKAVVVAVNSIIDKSLRAAAWSSMNTTGSTTAWSCWVVTERSVGHVLIKYKKAEYDEREERQKELTPSSWSVWVRPLADVVGLRYGAFYAAEGNPTVFDPAEPIKVIFSDGAVNIPAGPIPIDQRAEVGRITSALREFVNF